MSERVILNILKLGLATLLAILASPVFADILLFGGKNNKDFLGCYDCSKYESSSICNEYGIHGSQYSSSFIWNDYETYGNRYSLSSPWNEYSSSNDVPVLVDKEGNFYGYFTINEYRLYAVDFAGEMYKWFKKHDGNIEKVRRELCSFFGQGY